MKVALRKPVRAAASGPVAWARRHPIVPAGRRTRLVGAVLLAAVVVCSGTAATWERIDRLPEGAAFEVAGTATTIEQLDERVRLLGALYGILPPSDPAGMDEFRRATAKAVAFSDVIDRAAADEGVVVADKAAQDELSRIVETDYPAGRQHFVEQLGQLGLSEQSVVDEVKRKMANSQLYEKITKDVALPTDEEVATAYDQQRADMVSPERRHLRHIVVASEEDAGKVRAQLDQGADFAEVARTTSLDASGKDQGGELGVVVRDQMERAYGDAAFAAAPNGGLFGPVQTRYGWDVGQVLEVTPAVPLTLDQVREPLRAKLADDRKSKVWNDWLSERIADFGVRYAPEYQPADPSAAPPPSS